MAVKRGSLLVRFSKHQHHRKTTYNKTVIVSSLLYRFPNIHVIYTTVLSSVPGASYSTCMRISASDNITCINIAPLLLLLTCFAGWTVVDWRIFRPLSQEFTEEPNPERQSSLTPCSM